MSPISIGHDIRARFGPVRDQGGRETCLAFAMSDAHAAVRSIPWSPLSCEYLFYQAKQRDQTAAHLGTTIAAITAALQYNGQPVESAWPYLSALPSDPKQWKPPAKVGTLYYRTSTRSGHAFDKVWKGVETDQPIVIGMTFSRAFLMPNAAGIVDSKEAANPHLRHAVLAVATGRRGKQKLLLVRNSWGDTWGLSGYAWLTERYSSPRILAALTVN